MNDRHMAREIVRRRYGDRPATEPFIAGLYAFFIALVCAFVFRLLSSPDPDPESWKTTIASLVCAAIVAVIQWRRCEAYEAKVHSEEMRLWEASKNDN